MAGKADVQTHLENRREALETTFASWSKGGPSASERTAIIEDYFEMADIGQPRRVASGNSLVVKAPGIDTKRVHVLVVGRHDLDDLVARKTEPAVDAQLTGPALASRVGPMMAFCEGAQAAKALTVEEPVNITYLSMGDGDTISDVLPHIFTGHIDAAYLTSASQWSPLHPTITTGSRGRIVAELTLKAGADIDDYSVSGGVRNPLTKMTQILGALRDSRGRIALPGFYDRAHAPTSQARDGLIADDHDANAWTLATSVTAPSGGLSSLERAALWPGVSVLGIESSATDGSTAPGVVRATIALYLVPDQRHVEVERSLRAWFNDITPAELQPSVHLVSSARPFRSEAADLPVAAQTRAAYRLFGRQPILVPAGGHAGSGEVAFALHAPIGFAGIAPPNASTGTLSEHLAWSDFVYGTAMAAETTLQLRRV